MHAFEFYQPTAIVFGPGTEAQAGPKAAQLEARRVLVVYGGQSAKASGLLSRVLSSLDGAGLAHETFGGIHPNPRLFQAREGVQKALDFGADLILAVGGGSVIDASKAIALGAEDRVVGLEKKADTRPIYQMAAPELLEKPQVGTMKELDVEATAALEPELVIMPQALRNIMPQIGNNFIINIKDSSVLCVVGVSDLMFMTRSVAGIYYKGTECYLIAATVYLFLTYLSSLLLKAITGKMTAPDNTKRHQGNQTVDLGLPSSN